MSFIRIKVIGIVTGVLGVNDGFLTCHTLQELSVIVWCSMRTYNFVFCSAEVYWEQAALKQIFPCNNYSRIRRYGEKNPSIAMYHDLSHHRIGATLF